MIGTSILVPSNDGTPSSATPSVTAALPLVIALSNVKTTTCAEPARGSVLGLVNDSDSGRSKVPAAPCCFRDAADTRYGASPAPACALVTGNSTPVATASNVIERSTKVRIRLMERMTRLDRSRIAANVRSEATTARISRQDSCSRSSRFAVPPSHQAQKLGR